MVHPVVEKPIIEPTICRDGSVDYTCSNMVNPLVSFDMVKEFYDMNSKNLRTTINEIYNSISKINSSIEEFQSSVDRTQESFILLQRTVNSQLDNISHQVKNFNNQTTSQLDGFSDRLDHFESILDDVKANVIDDKENTDRLLSTINKRMDTLNAAMRDIESSFNEINDAVRDQKAALDQNTKSVATVSESLKYTTQRISQEIERAKAAEAKISEDIEHIKSSTVDVTGVASKIVNEETLRAQGVEMSLQDKINDNHKTAMNSIADLNTQIDCNTMMISDLNGKIREETERARGIEESIDLALDAETSRATQAEKNLKLNADGIYTEMNNKFSSINKRIDSIDVEGGMEEIREDISNAITVSTSSMTKYVDDTIKKFTEDQQAQIDECSTKVNQFEKTLMQKLDEFMAKTDQSLKEIKDSVDEKDMIDQVAVDNLKKAFNEMVDKVTPALRTIDGLSSTVSYLKQRSDEFDNIIDDKINRSISSIINRMENLDNRLDSEINYNRSTMRRLDHRLGVLEGSELEDDECDSCDKQAPKNYMVD